MDQTLTSVSTADSVDMQNVKYILPDIQDF